MEKYIIQIKIVAPPITPNPPESIENMSSPTSPLEDVFNPEPKRDNPESAAPSRPLILAIIDIASPFVSSNNRSKFIRITPIRRTNNMNAIVLITFDFIKKTA